jgi:hypothetical protein
VLSGEATNSNFIVFGLTRRGTTLCNHITFKEKRKKENPVLYLTMLDLVVFRMVMVIAVNATFNNISAISWQSFLLVEETGVQGEDHCPAAVH